MTKTRQNEMTRHVLLPGVTLLLTKSDDAAIQDTAWLLFDQALLLEGVPLKDPATFVQRLNRILNRSI